MSLPPDFTQGADQVRWRLRANNLTRNDTADVNDLIATVTGADEVIVTTATTITELETGDAVAFQVLRLGNVDTHAGTADVLGLRVNFIATPPRPFESVGLQIAQLTPTRPVNSARSADRSSLDPLPP